MFQVMMVVPENAPLILTFETRLQAELAVTNVNDKYKPSQAVNGFEIPILAVPLNFVVSDKSEAKKP